MAMSNGQQTSVDALPAVGFAGLIADNGPFQTRSYHNEESSAETPFGVMLTRGTTDEDEGALLPHTSSAAMATTFIGVLAHSHHYAETKELGETGLKPDVTLKVLTHGRIWVVPEEAVDPTDLVKVRVVTSGNEVAGAFRATADDTSDCVDISAYARWLTTADANTPALLEINMTGANEGVADS
jgi:hypothetical protein